MDYFDRYKNFRENGTVKIVPFIEIPKEATDVYITYDKNTMRMDTLSYKYYNDPNYGWLILQANPNIPPLEFMIKDGVEIRIPYPLSSALTRYQNNSIV